MTFTEDELRAHLEEARDDLILNRDIWRKGNVPFDGVTNIVDSTGERYSSLAKTAALLGAIEHSREWFSEAARYYMKRIRVGRQLRDVRGGMVWESEPRTLLPAINAALLSRDEDLLAEVAAVTLEIDESFLDVFAEDYPDSPAFYYDAKTRAALAIEDDRAPEFLGHLEAAIQQLADLSLYWETIPEYYTGILNGKDASVEAALGDLLQYYNERSQNPDTPSSFVQDAVCGPVVLARRHGLDVSVESDRVPEELLRDDVPEDAVELDLDLEVDVGSDVGVFELDRDDDFPVIEARIYHPGGKPVTADVVPDTDAGELLSDAWIEAALDEASWRDAYDDDLVADAKEAFADGTLTRKLVVLQDRMDEHTFDESLAALPVDDIELKKGAGRQH